MDPVTILGLTCNVLQLIELGYKGTALCWNLYKKGEDVDATRLKETCDTLDQAYQNLESSLQRSPSPNSEETILIDLCIKCEETSSKLKGELAALTLQPRSNAFRIIGQALKSSYKADKIRRLKVQLDELTKSLDTHVLISAYKITKQSGVSVQDLGVALDQKSREIVDEIAIGHLQLVELVSKEALACRDAVEKDHQATRAHLSAIHADISETIARDGLSTRTQVDKLSAQLDGLKVDNQHHDALTALMKKLEYSEMFARRESIEPAHKGTCEYIFQVESFERWLEQDDEPVFWIQGKAGSGKSTLMNFLMEESEDENGFIQNDLRKWASGGPIKVLSFYFWESGTPLQRNTEGLLRSLLWQVLNLLKSSSNTFVRKLTSIKTVSDIVGHPTLPGPRRLSELFCTMINQLQIPFYIMLDGLDEFGDDLDILDLVEDLRLLASVKLCVSSRPSQIFKDYFEDCPNITLQELTWFAIEKYVTEKLQQNKTFDRLIQQHPTSAADFISRVIERADGVFLWVKLVVKDLLKGLKLKDNMTTLEKRLEKLPNDLFALYEDMWRRNLDHELYEEEAAQHFGLLNYAQKTTKFSQEPLSLLTWGLALDPDLRSRCLSAIDDLDRPWFGFEMDDEHLMARLSVCTAGLLEIRHGWRGRSNPDVLNDPTAKVIDRTFRLEVHPIHKSVLDFYDKSPTLQQLAHARMEPGDYSQCLAEAHILSNGLSILTQTDDCDKLNCRYLDDDDTSIMWFERIERMVHRITKETNFKRKGFNPLTTFEEPFPGMYCREPRCPSLGICIGKHTVFDAGLWALENGYSCFTTHRVNCHAYSQDELNNMLWCWCWCGLTLSQTSQSLALLETLLQKGADPNAKPLDCHDTTPSPFPSPFAFCIYSLVFTDMKRFCEADADLEVRYYRSVNLLLQQHKDPISRIRTSYKSNYFVSGHSPNDGHVLVMVDWSLSDLLKIYPLWVTSRPVLEMLEHFTTVLKLLEPFDNDFLTRAYAFMCCGKVWAIHPHESEILFDHLRRGMSDCMVADSESGPILIFEESSIYRDGSLSGKEKIPREKRMPKELKRIFKCRRPFRSHYDAYKHEGWTEEQLKIWKHVWQQADQDMKELEMEYSDYVRHRIDIESYWSDLEDSDLESDSEPEPQQSSERVGQPDARADVADDYADDSDTIITSLNDSGQSKNGSREQGTSIPYNNE